MADALANFAYSTVATAPSPSTSGTVIVVQSGQGSRFPATPFNATVWPANTIPTPLNAEIVRVTGLTGDTLTITRAQESTTAQPVINSYQIAATLTASEMNSRPGTILGYTKYQPGSNTNYPLTAVGSMTQVDPGTNLNCSFVAPLSGTVLWTQNMLCNVSGVGINLIMQPYITTIGLVGSQQIVCQNTPAERIYHTDIITGLTPGTAYIVQPAYELGSAGTGGIYTGGSQGAYTFTVQAL